MADSDNIKTMNGAHFMGVHHSAGCAARISTMQTDRLSDRRETPTLDRMDSARVLFRVGIVLGLSGSINVDQWKALQAEASGIWKPYGIELSWFEPNADCGSHQPGDAMPVDWMLQVTSDSQEPPNAVLGAVEFREGVPDNTIHVRYEPLSRLILAAMIGSWSIGSMPRPLRDRLVGQAIGRVVAHELGHILLALPTHDRSGLMRPTFVQSDLIAGNRDRLRLSKTYLRRLEQRLTGLASP
jgi:hypothetical protein